MTEGIIAMAAALSIAISTIGPALAQGKTASTAVESMARQPEIAGAIRTAMIIGLAMIEALTIYGLLIAFMLLGKF